MFAQLIVKTKQNTNNIIFTTTALIVNVYVKLLDSVLFLDRIEIVLISIHVYLQNYKDFYFIFKYFK